MGSLSPIVLLYLSLLHGFSRLPCIASAVVDPLSDYGSLDGPLARVLARRRAPAIYNFGCPLSQVPFFAEGPGSVRCGQCLPGSTGVDRFTDPSFNVFSSYYMDSLGHGVPRCDGCRFGGVRQRTAGSNGFCDPLSYCADNGTCVDGSILLDFACASATECPGHYSCAAGRCTPCTAFVSDPSTRPSVEEDVHHFTSLPSICMSGRFNTSQADCAAYQQSAGSSLVDLLGVLRWWQGQVSCSSGVAEVDLEAFGAEILALCAAVLAVLTTIGIAAAVRLSLLS